jgi:hypothetical protein
MTELSDYKRLVEAPMVRRMEEQMAGLRSRAETAEATVSSLLADMEALKGELAALHAPGGWRALADADARRVLGDPTVGVMITTKGGIGHV